MSARYPAGSSQAWFPHKIKVVTAETRDKYGKIATETTIDTRGRVDIRAVELMENGARTTRNGARILVGAKPTFVIAIGTVITMDAKRWSVTNYSTKPSHQGEIHFYDCIAVEKATDK